MANDFTLSGTVATAPPVVSDPVSRSTIVSDLFKESMGIIGAIAIDEVPTPSEFNTCMATCNMMLDSWSAQRLMVRATTRESFFLVAGKGSYTIGTGGDFNTGKPIKIIDALLTDGSRIQTPVNVIDKFLYDSYGDTLITAGRPENICYDPGSTQQSAQKGTIYVYYTPDASTPYTLTLESHKYLTEFATLADTVTFEPAYFAAISWNLAEWIWPKFNRIKPVPGVIQGLARSTKRTVQNMNTSSPNCNIDLPGTKRGNWSINTGD